MHRKGSTVTMFSVQAGLNVKWVGCHPLAVTKQLKVKHICCRLNLFLCTFLFFTELFDEAYDPMCSNDRKAYSVKSESNFRSPFFGDSCKDLLCPKGYMCNQTNFMFAKCCPTADCKSIKFVLIFFSKLFHNSLIVVEDEEPKKEEIAVCPTGTPIKDFAAGGYRLCNAESSCPNSSFCWNVSHPHERNVQGVCCPSPKSNMMR